jgi:dTMP kinase
MKVTKGFFIAIEGGEGAGKSTHSKRLAAHLEALGHEVVLTREPGGTPTAEKIRSVLLDPEVIDLPDRAEALLFAAARADHAANLIRPALARGAVVICDRYLESSVAYQGYARGLDPEFIRSLSVWATEELLPDFTIYLDVPHEAHAARMDGDDRMEMQSEQFHIDVLAAFRQMAGANPNPHILIDATAEKDLVATQIREAIDSQLS